MVLRITELDAEAPNTPTPHGSWVTVLVCVFCSVGHIHVGRGFLFVTGTARTRQRMAVTFWDEARSAL